MNLLKTTFKGITVVTLALLISAGGISTIANAEEVSEQANSVPTLRMGDNAPMTSDELMAWARQRGVRHFSNNGEILPVNIFFNARNGSSFSYSVQEDIILHVQLIPGLVSEPRTVSPAPQAISVEEFLTLQANQAASNTTPVTFDSPAPIFFTDEELTAMIESVPNATPLDAISNITLPNRRLTETELAAWIEEYNTMGGATAFELGVIREVNRVRVSYGLHPVALNPALMMSARLKTQEFGDLQYFDHYSPVHGTVTDAARMFGFEGSAAGEAIARSGSNGAHVLRTNPERVVGGMLASTRGHRELLLNPNLYSVGFGSFFSPNSTGRDGNMSHIFYLATKFEFVFD